mmetsp:Transcript_59887/g.110911  ORF Transcript_59887/g.110911 Transcript_59887/m.110911 type:complete len:474 (+) Transcript_59887:104-1525(+)
MSHYAARATAMDQQLIEDSSSDIFEADLAKDPSRGSGAGPSEVVATDSMLPRDLPFVGFLRHAPRHGLPDRLERLLKRRQAPSSISAEGARSSQGDDDLKSVEQDWTKPPSGLKRMGSIPRNVSSPLLTYSEVDHDGDATLPLWPLEEKAVSCLLPPSAVDHRSPDGVLGSANTLTLQSLERGFCNSLRLPEELWATVLSYLAEVKGLHSLCSLGHGYGRVLQWQYVWAGRHIRLPSAIASKALPKFGAWLQAWRSCSKLVVPYCEELIAEVALHAPDVPLEVAWRFDTNMKGTGVEVLNDGEIVHRVNGEDLVVIGDAPLPSSTSTQPYLEVRLDERGEDLGDSFNDFGIGLTASNPLLLHALGTVADEVPHSWVLDFMKSAVALSINNTEAMRSDAVTAGDLQEGDRVGILVSSDGGLELFINGISRHRFVPRPEDRVPLGAGLFPVLDLYGRTVQVSRTFAEEPCASAAN